MIPHFAITWNLKASRPGIVRSVCFLLSSPLAVACLGAAQALAVQLGLHIRVAVVEGQQRECGDVIACKECLVGQVLVVVAAQHRLQTRRRCTRQNGTKVPYAQFAWTHQAGQHPT